MLLTTFSDTLANVLRTKLRRLIHNENLRLQNAWKSPPSICWANVFIRQVGAPKIAMQEILQKLLSKVTGEAETQKFSHRFLLSEWDNVVDAWQLDSWDARDAPAPRAAFDALAYLRKGQCRTSRIRHGAPQPEMFGVLAERLKDLRNPLFDFAVVDEAQHISVASLRFLAALGNQRTNSFFSGDLGQRIFQTPSSWKALGVHVRRRSQTLRLNYRTSHQIRMQADRLLGSEVADVDGNIEDQWGTASAFSGQPPSMRVFETKQEESEAVRTWLQERRKEGVGGECNWSNCAVEERVGPSVRGGQPRWAPFSDHG